MAARLEYLTTKDVAKSLGCSLVWAWTLISTGTIPSKRIGRTWVVTPAALRSYLRKHPPS